MENISPSIYSRNKIIIIIIGAVLNILTTPLIFVLDEKGLFYKLIHLITVIIFNLLTFAWCYYDSLERNQRLSVGWRFLIVIFGIFAVLFYLLKSRGIKKGLVSVGKALLIFIGIFVVSVLISATFATILESLGIISP